MDDSDIFFLLFCTKDTLIALDDAQEALELLYRSVEGTPEDSAERRLVARLGESLSRMRSSQAMSLHELLESEASARVARMQREAVAVGSSGRA